LVINVSNDGRNSKEKAMSAVRWNFQTSVTFMRIPRDIKTARAVLIRFDYAATVVTELITGPVTIR